MEAVAMKQKNHSKSMARRGHRACTTMVVGKKATVDDSVIVAHSDDDVADERLIYVPAAQYSNGAQRPVYYDDASLGHKSEYNSTELRRYIGTSRGPGYDTKDYPLSKPLGNIPQVKHTFAYFDSNYGVMNEHQLMIGECTCGAKVHPEPEPDKRIFYSAELSRVALERCKKAREAIRLMDRLIMDYGLYGTDETLLIGDPKEAWVMEMCGYDTDGSDGIWVAQRVPDDGYFVAANEFRIREVSQDARISTVDIKAPKLTMICSDNLFDVCTEKGWWKPSQGPLDWLPTVSWGEYSHPYYSLRRVWRALSKAKPSLILPAWVQDGYTKAYPFSVTPDRKLSVADVAAIYRDHYEGTEFDMTKSLAAGPYGDPTRYEGNPDKGDTFNLNTYHPRGAWERPLSIYRCGMMWINQGRSFLPNPVGGVSWVGLDRPAANCLMPFFAGVTSLPPLMETMNLIQFSRDSAWWAFNFVANYATLRYCYMMKDINEKQKELEDAAYEAVDAYSEDTLQKNRKNMNTHDLTAFCNDIVEKVVASWWELSERLIVKYNDGCITDETNIMQPIGYPTRAWLKEVGYYEGPVQY